VPVVAKYITTNFRPEYIYAAVDCIVAAVIFFLHFYSDDLYGAGSVQKWQGEYTHTNTHPHTRARLYYKSVAPSRIVLYIDTIHIHSLCVCVGVGEMRAYHGGGGGFEPKGFARVLMCRAADESIMHEFCLSASSLSLSLSLTCTYKIPYIYTYTRCPEGCRLMSPLTPEKLWGFSHFDYAFPPVFISTQAYIYVYDTNTIIYYIYIIYTVHCALPSVGF